MPCQAEPPAASGHACLAASRLRAWLQPELRKVVAQQEDQWGTLRGPSMAGAVKVMERMSSQVQQLEIAMDLKASLPCPPAHPSAGGQLPGLGLQCKLQPDMQLRACTACGCCSSLAQLLLQYWDDIMDAYEEHKGSLLPLWKFYTDKARRKQVGAAVQDAPNVQCRPQSKSGVNSGTACWTLCHTGMPSCPQCCAGHSFGMEL